MPPSIFLAVPCLAMVDARFMVCVLNLVRWLHRSSEPPFSLRLEFGIGDSLVPRARNRLAARFLGTAATHLLFIDSDIVFAPEHVEQLVISSSSIPAPCVTAGRYALKHHETTWAHEPPVPAATANSSSDLVPVSRAGTGFMLIDRGVLTTLAKDKSRAYEAEPGDMAGWDFFSSGIYDGRYVGEDHAFCDASRAAGFGVYVHPRITVRHMGHAAYPLN